MPLAFEQLAPALYKQAIILAKKCFGFEVNELVAECWLMGNVQKLKNIKYVHARARFDMIDYIRLQTGYRIKQHAQRKADSKRNRGNNEHVLQNGERLNVTNCSLQTVLYADNHGEYLLQDDLPGKSDGRPEHIDTKDLFDRLCKGLNRQESLILKLIFVDNFNQAETGRVMDLSESRISQKLANLLPRIRIILKNLQLTENINKRREGQKCRFKRDKRDLAEYQHRANLNSRKRANEARIRKRHALAV